MIDVANLALDAPEGSLLLEGLALRIPKGANQLVTGPSGVGKSRLLKVIAGVERPLRGRVRVAGIELWPGDGALGLVGKVSVGFAFASGGLLSNLSLRENVALPLRFLKTAPSEVHRRTEAALERLGLAAVAGLRPHAVSAAARRHGNLARVLALEPELILLDDPLEGLDAADRAVALEVIHPWLVDADRTVLIAQEEPGPFADGATSHLDLSAHAIPLETP